MTDFDQVLAGTASSLTLKGSPPSSVVSSLRVLNELGVLNHSMVWAMLSTVAIDPFHMIRTVRGNKADLGFVEEEHLVGEDVVFLAGDKNSLGYRVTYHVNVFTNDISILIRTGDNYTYHSGMHPLDLIQQLEAENNPVRRLEIVLNTVKSQIAAALVAK